MWFANYDELTPCAFLSRFMDNGQHHILIVDDDPDVAQLLRTLLEADGHAVERACDGVDALEYLQKRLPDLVFLDLDMPRMNGFELCRRIKSNPRTRLLPVVILTGQSESDARLRAWSLDADDFLTKPFHRVEVTARCHALLRVKDLVDELDCAQTVVFSLARAIEAKSRYTQGHSERVTAYSLALALRVGVKEQDHATLRRGAALHDVGKIAVPDEILNKETNLTPEEFELVKIHPVAGVRIVEPLRSVRDAIPLIRWHHERMDGRGYPDGLAGENIPLLARILSVADVFDALASSRPYRAAIPLETCLHIMRESARTGGLDPNLVQAFCAEPAIPASTPVE
jgi:putative two-component system response regulator